MAANTIPILPNSEWLETLPLPKGLLPLATPAIHPLTLFFGSLYYPGRQQWKVAAQSETGCPLIRKEVTPFLKSRVSFAVWMGCKILVQASLLWNWRIWCGVNVLGIFCRLMQWRQLKRSTTALVFKALFHTQEPKVLPRPTVAAQHYLEIRKTPKVLRAFFKTLTEEQFTHFCRWMSLQPPEDVTQLLMLDFQKNLLLSQQDYDELIDAIIRKNSDAFACFYPLLTAYRKLENPTEFQQQSYATIKQAVLKTLAVSSPTEQQNTPWEFGSGEMEKVDAMAFSILLSTLPNNDRAHAAQCCKKWHKASRTTQHVPPIQRDVGLKLLWWAHQDRSVPLDQFSIGQIEELLKTAHRYGVLEKILTYVKGPGLNLEKWRRACECALSYPSKDLHLGQKPFLLPYCLQQTWHQIEDKKREFALNLSGLTVHSTFQIVDPLAVHLLEQGSEEDKALVCSVYFEEMATSDAPKLLFLYLLNYYVDKPTFQTHFLAPFQGAMKKQAAHFSITLAKEKGFDSNGEQSLEQFLTKLVSNHLGRGSSLFLSSLQKLKDPILATLLIRQFASYICWKPHVA